MRLSNLLLIAAAFISAVSAANRCPPGKGWHDKGCQDCQAGQYSNGDTCSDCPVVSTCSMHTKGLTPLTPIEHILPSAVVELYGLPSGRGYPRTDWRQHLYQLRVWHRHSRQGPVMHCLQQGILRRAPWFGKVRVMPSESFVSGHSSRFAHTW